ncbi:hypothetical protein ACROYT_G020341 [Oculina patagonica]
MRSYLQTSSPSSVLSPLGEESSFPELRESTTKLANDGTELSDLPLHVAFQEKPSSIISPCATISPVEEDTSFLREVESNVNLVDGEDRLDEELDWLTSYAKPSSAISPVNEHAISPKVEASTIKLAVDEDQLKVEAVDVMCHAKPCSAISPFEDVALFTAVTNASTPVVEGNAVNLVPVEGKHDGEPDHVTCLKGQSSTLGTVVTDVPLQREKKNKKKTEKKSKKTNNTGLSQSGTKSDDEINTPFQRWLQNFTKFCKDQDEMEEKQMEPNR